MHVSQMLEAISVTDTTANNCVVVIVFLRTSVKANLSATSLVHWKSRVNRRVSLKTETGTVVTFASCPASLSQSVITWDNQRKSKKKVQKIKDFANFLQTEDGE